MITREITATRLAQAPGAVVDDVLNEGPAWLTRSGRRVIALVPSTDHSRAEHQREVLWEQLGRLVEAAGGTWPGAHALNTAAMLDLTQDLIDRLTAQGGAA